MEGVEGVRADKSVDDVEANGVEDDESSDAITVTSQKPLVYNYDDTDNSQELADESLIDDAAPKNSPGRYNELHVEEEGDALRATPVETLSAPLGDDMNECIRNELEESDDMATSEVPVNDSATPLVGVDEELSVVMDSESAGQDLAEVPVGEPSSPQDEVDEASADAAESATQGLAGVPVGEPSSPQDEVDEASADAAESATQGLAGVPVGEPSSPQDEVDEASADAAESATQDSLTHDSSVEHEKSALEDYHSDDVTDPANLEESEAVTSKEVAIDDAASDNSKENKVASVVAQLKTENEGEVEEETLSDTSDESPTQVPRGPASLPAGKLEEEAMYAEMAAEAEIDCAVGRGGGEVKCEEGCAEDESVPVLVTRGDGSASAGQNFKHAILEDWEGDGGATPASDPLPDEVEGADPLPDEAEGADWPADEPVEPPAGRQVELIHTFTNVSAAENPNTPAHVNGVGETPGKSRLFLANFKMSRAEAVQEILRSNATPLKALLPKKDLILAMELAKHSSQGVVAGESPADHQREEILGILEADQVGDWREALSTSRRAGGNDLDISRELNAAPPATPASNGVKPNKRLGRPKPDPNRVSAAKLAAAQREQERAVERALALEQLAQDFRARPRRRRGPGNAPLVAAEDLERALASTPVLTGKRKRRPCYQPASQIKDEPEAELKADPSAIIKTYVPKTRNADAIDETALQTIAIVNRHLAHGDQEPVPNPLKTGKKLKKSVPQKKRARELQQLLGDEGAVRMLYDAAQKDAPNDVQPRVFKKTKKGLQLKSKFVENAVLRLCGASEKSLRGKRSAVGPEPSPEQPDPLFPPAAPTATPGAQSTPGRARKKVKPAEASRILYRHSSSESFDGSEGLRRSVSEIAGLDASPERGSGPAREAVTQRKSSRPRKVSSKFSVYVAESLSPKKAKKSADSAPADETADTVPASKVTPDVPSPRVAQPTPPASPVPLTPVKVARGSRKQASSEVRVTPRGVLVEITLTSHKPTIKNGLTVEVLKQLAAALSVAEANPSCRAVLLTTDGDVFCQGIDLAALKPGSNVTHLVAAIKLLVTVLAGLQKPVIAGVQGAAVGMGVSLLPLCDLVVASDRATFFTPYTRLGQGLEAGASLTFPRIGKALVSELIYKCSVLSAADALRLGLVSQTAPAAEFPAELAAVAHAVAAQPDQALRMTKELLTGSARQSILEAVDRECDALLQAWANAECQAAAAAFLDSDLLPND